MKKILLKSPAKINLTLEVVKKLPNGFHELRTVMMKLENIYDKIELKIDDKKKGIKISCEVKNVPTDKENICWKIAEKFFEKTGKEVGLIIKIKKGIPLSSGLGGGSSDGASVLLALNNYFNKPLKKAQLIEVASDVGKDIPFFLIKEKVAYVSGMGDEIKNIINFYNLNLVIINPQGEIATPWAYGKLDKELKFMQDKNRKNISSKFLKNKNSCLYNDFEIVAKKKYPIIEVLENFMLSLGAVQSSLSGKGPTVFGIFKTKKEALKAKNVLKKYYPKFFIEVG